jgi:hypothetical protein
MRKLSSLKRENKKSDSGKTGKPAFEPRQKIQGENLLAFRCCSTAGLE